MRMLLVVGLIGVQQGCQFGLQITFLRQAASLGYLSEDYSGAGVALVSPPFTEISKTFKCVAINDVVHERYPSNYFAAQCSTSIYQRRLIDILTARPSFFWLG